MEKSNKTKFTQNLLSLALLGLLLWLTFSSYTNAPNEASQKKIARISFLNTTDYSLIDVTDINTINDIIYTYRSSTPIETDPTIATSTSVDSYIVEVYHPNSSQSFYSLYLDTLTNQIYFYDISKPSNIFHAGSYSDFPILLASK